ncbi:MAG: DUF935 family protein [Candidatus Nanopelagicales bacterium]
MARKKGRGAATTAPPAAPALAMAPTPTPDLLAPAPLIDRYPVVLGSGLTLQYVSNALRICTTGYRQNYVDLFNELIERDAHAQAMVVKRVQTIAGARLSIDPPDLPPDHPEADLAREIAETVSQRILGLPDLTQRLASLARADILGVAASEVVWGDVDGGFWPRRLTFVHSRRLAYPDAGSWDLHLWDQGSVTGYGWDAPTNRPGFGLNITRDMPPGKFVVHTPQFRDDYPTREGLGRALVWLMAFKIIGMRQGASFIERYTKILTWASYATTSTDVPRAASPDDIAQADATVKALGIGTLTAATLADAIKIHMDGPALKGSASTMTVPEWIAICDEQTTRLLLGNTFTTSAGKFGSKSTSETGKEGELEGARLSAGMLCQTLDRDLLVPCVDRNWPGRTHLAPRATLHLDKPSPHAVLDLNTKAAASGIPVDADAVARQCGVPTLAPDNVAGRRMVPVSAGAPPPLDPSRKPDPAPVKDAPPTEVAPEKDAPTPDDIDRPRGGREDDPDTAEGGVTDQAGGDAGDD